MMMHILINGNYALNGVVFEQIIPAANNLVFLFMMISSFSMCCGYYEKMRSGNVDLERFYRKRFEKVWPFFAFLTAMDIVISPSVEAVYEGFANLTLCFGLLPNARISVIGVGWTLGVIFVFYLLFPFFCFLMSTGKRRWLTMLAAILMNLACKQYFFDETHVVAGYAARNNFLYCAVYFISGGLVWFYKDLIQRILGKWFDVIMLGSILVGCLMYGVMGSSTISMLVLYTAVLLYAVGRKSKKGLLNNKVAAYVSTLSMEIYLCHMVVFRVIEKIGWLKLFSNELLSYVAAVIITGVGSVCFILAAKFMFAKIGMLLKNKR